uniref:DUF6562 domain-containing protein n=1 Tax=Alistipes sp. TaxID=1872444 RepID=UPI0040560A3F
MKRLRDILLLLLVAILTSCDATIHEYPDNAVIRPVSVPITLNFNFDTEMPLYKQMTYTRSNLKSSDFDLRYIVNVYRATTYRQIGGDVVASYVFSKDDVNEWNHTVEIELEKGYYDFVVWADYVDAGTVTDKYYDTSNFSIISLFGEHSGSNDYRDGFIGYGKFDLTADPAPYNYTIPMSRPMAKYRFISNDIDTFISRMLEIKRKRLEASRGEDEDTKADTKVEVNINDYYVKFNYTQFLNTAYNALINIPAVPLGGYSFTSNIQQLSDKEAELGFDYIFVGDDTKVWVSVEVFERDENGGESRGEAVGGIKPFLVELSRSKLTEVRGPFLTTEEQGGVGINPDFEDEFTIEIH